LTIRHFLTRKLYTKQQVLVLPELVTVLIAARRSSAMPLLALHDVPKTRQ
jgi:hypothetical protein